MSSPAMRLGKWHQGYLYATGTLLVLSGALWLLFHYFVRMPGQFGDMPHPLEPVWLTIHGLCGAAFLIGFGSVMPGHVRRAWSARRNRWSGTLFFALLSLLAASGYGLYYIGDDAVRSFVSAAHWIVGLGIPVLMGWHIWLGRASRRHKIEAAKPGVTSDSESALRLIHKP